LLQISILDSISARRASDSWSIVNIGLKDTSIVVSIFIMLANFLKMSSTKISMGFCKEGNKILGKISLMIFDEASDNSFVSPVRRNSGIPLAIAIARINVLSQSDACEIVLDSVTSVLFMYACINSLLLAKIFPLFFT